MKELNAIDKKEEPFSFVSQEPGREEVQRAEHAQSAQLAGDIPVLNFPGSVARCRGQVYEGKSLSHAFSKGFLGKIKAFSRRQDVALFTALLAGVNILLHKYTGQDDLIVCTPDPDMERRHEGDRNGLFSNMLIIWSRLDQAMSFKAFSKIMQRSVLEEYAHKTHLSDEMMEKLNVQVSLTDGYPDRNPGRLDLNFFFVEAEELTLVLEYNSYLFDDTMMIRIFKHYEQIMERVVQDANIPLKDIDYVTAEEKEDLLAFNPLQADYPIGSTLIDLFEEQVKRTPDKKAVVFNGSGVTYRELHEKSHQLAAWLAARNVRKGDCVLLCFSTSMEGSVAAILGIMKSGAAYVPLDADVPGDRVTYLIGDTRAAVVVTNKQDSAIFEGTGLHVVCMDDEGGDWAAMGRGGDHCGICQDDTAYIIYTSGTTGNPKGAMISYRNLTDYFYGLDHKIGLHENKVNCMMSTFATDLGNTLLYSSLIYGNEVHLLSKDALRDVEYIHKYFNEHNIDCIKIVPTYWKYLEFREALLLPTRMIIFGGEELPVDRVKRIRKVKPDLRIINHYGPTEATIGKLIYEVGVDIPGPVIPIGNPFSNTRIYIVDKHLSLCAKGIWGELLIGGDGVFKGYLNRPSLTEEKLIENRFGDHHGKLYRTGDLVRINQRDEIEFGSRYDNQVKIQGYRIELGEIEAIISRYVHVRTCCVSTITNLDSNKMIVAYIVVKEGYSKELLSKYLRKNLSAYMIPAIVTEVPDIPMISSGKVDRKRLPAIDLLKMGAGFVPAENEVQRIIIGILKEIFNRDAIGINDNFFELGGDSIKSIQVVSRLRQKGYNLHLGEIMKAPVIKDFSDRVRVHAGSKSKEDMFCGAIPLSPIQKLFFQDKEGGYNHYNQSVVLYAKEIKEEIVRGCFGELTKFHDTLNIKFKEESRHNWVQYYDSSMQAYSFITDNYETESDFLQKIGAVSKRIDIQLGPLIVLGLFKNPDGDRLFIVIHHLLIDAVSFRILAEDLLNLYEKFLFHSDFELRHKSSSFKEWQLRLAEYAGKDYLSKELESWREIGKSAFDRIRIKDGNVLNIISEREKYSVSIGEGLTSDLLTRCYKKYNTEINEILVTALCLSLNEEFGLTKLLLNMEGHGREDIGYDLDVSRTIGWFTSIFPVYFILDPEKDHLNNLFHIKKKLRNIPNKGMSYGVLKYLVGEDLHVQPEITFNYLGDFSSSLRNRLQDKVFYDLKFNYQDASGSIRCNDILNFTGIVDSKRLVIHINYNRFHFSDLEIERLGGRYKDHLSRIITSIVSP